MSTLILLNGPPGIGKSTLAQALSASRPLMLALDVDAIKFSLGHWAADLTASGLQARRLAIAMAEQHLADGHDVVLGQYLAKHDFIDELSRVAARRRAEFVEILLTAEEAVLSQRLARRHAAPDRPEQTHNNRLVGPDDASALIESLRSVASRPGVLVVDASGSVAETLAQLTHALTN